MTAVKLSVKNEFAFFQTWTPSICQMQATFPEVEFLKHFIQVQKEEGKFVVLCPRPL